jgi:hypothetical protein
MILRYYTIRAFTFFYLELSRKIFWKHLKAVEASRYWSEWSIHTHKTLTELKLFWNQTEYSFETYFRITYYVINIFSVRVIRVKNGVNRKFFFKYYCC